MLQKCMPKCVIVSLTKHVYSIVIRGLTSLVIFPCPSKSYSVKENSWRLLGSSSSDTSHSKPYTITE